MALTVIVPPVTTPALAASGDRTLYLHHTHTGETAQITFKRNGRYDQDGLRKLNYFLRDWRTNEPTTMDPALFDLVWQVYQSVGATQPINIVSSYRSPKTNAMLRASSSGVAENSQHIKGKAMDFFIPGIDLATLRATAMRFQVGGVGYYPTSGSPFVHLDTGSVRAWPRMTTAQLKRVFPDGKTLHLPADGKPLSSTGRQYAMAEWQKCHSVPCGVGDSVGGGGNIFDSLFGKKQSPVVQVADNGPAQRAVQTVEVTAPVPLPAAERPGQAAVVQTASLETAAPALPFGNNASAPLTQAELSGNGEVAPIPMQKSERLMVATNSKASAETAVVALASLEAPVPAARVLMTNPPAELVTAYAPQPQQDPEAQRALEMIISRDTTASLPPKPVIDPSSIRTASLGGGAVPKGGLSGLFDTTWNAVGKAGTSAPAAKAAAQLAASQPIAGVATRSVDLVAPDFDHVAEIFTQPQALSSATYGVLWEPDEGDLDPATELGPYVARLGFVTEGGQTLESSRFVTGRPLLVASR